MSEQTIRPSGPPPSPESRLSDNVVKILHLLKCCQEESPEYNTLWTVVPLSPDQYKELWQHLEKDEDDSDLVGYVKAKIHYDYDAFRCQFTLRQTFKPSHAVFKNRVVGHIESQLDRLRSSSNLDVATHAGKIMNMGSSHIRFHLDNAMVYESDQRCSESVTASDKEQYRCPDCSFRHRNCRDSSVVIEISHPQKRLAMNCLAEDYIFGTNGNIKVVIGLHIEYQGRQKATMSVWVPKITSEGFFVDKKVKATQSHHQPFRNADGSVNSEGDLRLNFTDFAPCYSGFDPPNDRTDLAIIIPASCLCKYLDEAERAQYMLEGNPLALKDE